MPLRRTLTCDSSRRWPQRGDFGVGPLSRFYISYQNGRACLGAAAPCRCALHSVPRTPADNHLRFGAVATLVLGHSKGRLGSHDAPTTSGGHRDGQIGMKGPFEDCTTTPQVVLFAAQQHGWAQAPTINMQALSQAGTHWTMTTAHTMPQDHERATKSAMPPLTSAQSVRPALGTCATHLSHCCSAANSTTWGVVVQSSNGPSMPTWPS